jgi:hypothetical protein
MNDLETTKKIMGALVRMRPKPHEEMKLGKSRGKPRKSTIRKRSSASATAKTV